MKHDAFRYDFTPRELLYFLSGKHICPKCGGSMAREKKSETRQGREFNSRSAAPFRPSADVKHYYYEYHCENCGSSFTLQELARRKPDG